MNNVDIVRGRSRVEVEADIFGDYTREAIQNLRRAVADACRAIGTEAALKLADDVTEAAP